MEFNLERCVLGRRCFRAGLFLSLWATHCATAAPSKRVLILDSFMRDVPPFSTGASAFRTTLSHELGESVNICEVPMDMERFADTAVEKPFFNFLDERLATCRWTWSSCSGHQLLGSQHNTGQRFFEQHRFFAAAWIRALCRRACWNQTQR